LGAPTRTTTGSVTQCRRTASSISASVIVAPTSTTCGLAGGCLEATLVDSRPLLLLLGSERGPSPLPAAAWALPLSASAPISPEPLLLGVAVGACSPAWLAPASLLALAASLLPAPPACGSCCCCCRCWCHAGQGTTWPSRRSSPSKPLPLITSRMARKLDG
jgi:hypothetical protein